MTEYGFLVLNKLNYILVDQTYKNYSLKETGSTSCSVGVNNINITDTSENIFFATKYNTSGFIHHSGFVMSGSNKTHIQIYCSASMTVDWLVFQPKESTTPTGYGMVVYDSNGDITWSSDDKWLKLIANQSNSATAALPTTTPGTLSVTNADDNYFYCSTVSYYSKESYAGHGGCSNYPDNYYKIWGHGFKKKDTDELYEMTECLIHSGTSGWVDGLCHSYTEAHASTNYNIIEISI